MMQLGEKTKTVVVICAFAQYNAPAPVVRNRTQLPELNQIGPAVRRLQALFSCDRYQSAGIEIIPPLLCTTKVELQEKLSEIRKAVRDRPATNLILFWSGHGGLDTGSFRLATPDTYAPIEQEDGLGIDEVSREVGVARVSSWTLFLDACHAGAGFEDVVKTVNRQVMGEATQLRSFGALFSSAPYERARDSVFLNTVIDVLENGPSPTAKAYGDGQGGGGEFNPFNKLLSMHEVFEAVPAEYEADAARYRNANPPMSVFGGSQGLRIFPNPQFRTNQPSRLVEDAYRAIARPSDLESHFFPKAIGIDNLETGWHFTGRVDATRAILEWIKQQPLATPADSLYVLAADGGTGKSALLGRLIALTDKDYRSKAAAQGWDEKADRKLGTVPEINQIDAALNLRNLTAQSTADYLSDILKIAKTQSVEDFVKSAREAYGIAHEKTDGSAPCMVLDALDEAEDPSSIVRRVIRPLASDGWKVLVATRPSAQTRGASDLLAALGEATRYRLDQDAQSRDDIYHYAYGRLKEDKARVAVAESAAQMIADRANNKFLFARMSTSSLLRSAADVTPETLDNFIAHNATAALQKDVADLDTAFQNKFARSDLGTTSMLTALAWAQGEGVPIRDGIWAAITTAIAQNGDAAAHFEDLHILWLLGAAGRYIQEAGDGEQAVYRLFHKSLVEHFQAARTREQKTERAQEERLAQALVERVRASKDWQYTNPYLVRHMPAHLAARPSQKGLNNLLLNFDWVQARLYQSGIQSLLNDYYYCNNAYPATARLHRTLSMVSHILREHPEQLIPQMLGRIVPGVPDISALLDGQPGANFGLPPPAQDGLDESRRIMLRTPDLHIEQIGPDLVDRTVRLDQFLERARASIRGTIWVPRLGALAQAGALVRVLQGHDGEVSSVAVSADGKTIVSGGKDGTLRVWDARVGTALRTLQGHTGRVTCVVVSPDSKTIVSGSYDKTVRVWDAQTGAALNTLQGHHHWVHSVAMSPNGKTIVSGSGDRTARVWDAQTGVVLCTLRGHQGKVTSVAVSPDSKTIFSGSNDKTVRVWDAQSGAALRTMRGHEDCVTSLAVSADGKTFVSGGDDRTVRVWDAHVGAVLYSLIGHTSLVNSVAVSLANMTIVSGSTDKTVRVWNAENGTSVRILQGHKGAVNGVAISPDGNTIVSGSEDTTLRVWDALTKSTRRDPQGHSGPVNTVTVSPDGRTVISGGQDTTVRISDAHSGAALLTLLEHDGPVRDVAVSPDGKTIVTGSTDRTVRVWDAQTGRVLRTLQGHERSVESVVMSPDGKTIVSGSFDCTLRVWDAQTGGVLRSLQGHEDRVASVARSLDGKTIVSGSYDETLRVWDAKSGVVLRTLNGHEGPVISVAMSPNGETIFSASYDKTVRVWDARTGGVLHTINASAHSVAVSSDGKTFVSGGADGDVCVWDARTGGLLERLSLDAAVVCVAFDHFQRSSALVVATGDSVIRLVRFGGEQAKAR